MSNFAVVLRVAVWEFRRFFKWHEQFWSILLSVLIGGTVVGVVHLVRKGGSGSRSSKVVNISVLNADRLPGVMEALGARFKPVETSGTLSNLRVRNSLQRGTADAILSIDTPESATLLVMKRTAWEADLTFRLTEANRRYQLATRGLDGEELRALMAPVSLHVEYHESGRPPLVRGERPFITAVVTAMLIAVMSGNALLFTGITGEKESRITEQVISAITPQQWIDGKMLGLSWVTFASLINSVLGISFILALSQLLFGPFSILPGALDATVGITAVLCGVFGYYFWCAFFSAVAATIDNPNHSGRSAFIMLPMLPLAVGYFVNLNPESLFVRICTLLPLTSPAVLPARMVLVGVPVWEVATSIALLIGSIWVLRRAAGKIFGMGVLMYGKEPSLREMWRWLREP